MINPYSLKAITASALFFVFTQASHAMATDYTASQSGSTLAYRLKHPMHLIHGESKNVTCKVRLSDDTLTSVIACSAPMSSFDSGNENRDSHMLEVVEGLRYPTVSFTGHPVRHDGEHWQIAGNLTFHGITHPIAFPVTSTFTSGQVRIQGEFPVSLSEYKVKRPSLMFVATEDTVRIQLNIVGKFP